MNTKSEKLLKVMDDVQLELLLTKHTVKSVNEVDDTSFHVSIRLV